MTTPQSLDASGGRSSFGPGMRVSLATPADSDQWNDFLERSGRGTFYQLAEWRLVLEESFGHSSSYFIARDSGGVAGVLPLVLVQSRLFGRILCSAPFVNYGGVCANDEDTASLLVQEAMEKARRMGVDYLELRSAQPLPVDLPVSDHKVSLTIELDKDPDQLWNAFSSKHRNNIRRAQKQQLDVTVGSRDQLPAFYEVMERSWRALGTPLYSMDFFAEIVSRFGELTRIFVCRQDGVPIAAALNGYFNGTVEGLWAGMSPEARRLQANYVLYWEMIRDACERGFRHYHLGRSTADSGGVEFKRKWNATARQLYWYYFLPDGGKLPALNVDNPRYRMASRVWRRMPLNVLRHIGPRLAPLIP